MSRSPRTASSKVRPRLCRSATAVASVGAQVKSAFGIDRGRHRWKRLAAMGRKQRFKLRHYRKAPAKAIAAAPAPGERKCNVSEIRNLISRWHRDELGAERKAARRKCSESVSTDSRHYPQERGARFAEGGGRFTGMPRMTLRLRYRILKLRALCRALRRLRAGRIPWPDARKPANCVILQEIAMADRREDMPEKRAYQWFLLFICVARSA
jgi:hypothetical protein